MRSLGRRPALRLNVVGVVRDGELLGLVGIGDEINDSPALTQSDVIMSERLGAEWRPFH